jgi:preprotein translocase subunit SecA
MVTGILKKIFGSRNDRLLKQYRRKVVATNALEAEIAKLSDDALRAKTGEFRGRIQAHLAKVEGGAQVNNDAQERARREILDELLPEAFAVACDTLTCNCWAASRCITARFPRCAPARAKR